MAQPARRRKQPRGRGVSPLVAVVLLVLAIGAILVVWHRQRPSQQRHASPKLRQIQAEFREFMRKNPEYAGPRMRPAGSQRGRRGAPPAAAGQRR